MPDSTSGTAPDHEVKPSPSRDEHAVILLQGRNDSGEKIFSYLSVSLPKIPKLYAALNSGDDFDPVDFGHVIASGMGDPPDDLRERMAKENSTMQPIAPATFGPG
jgi:hypothetical protein